MDITKLLTYPFQVDLLLRKRKSIIRNLLARRDIDYLEKRIAILGGSTTADIKDILELFLLSAGIKPILYESAYEKYFEDAVFGSQELDDFQPEIVIIWTSFVNLKYLPVLQDEANEVKRKLSAEYNRFVHIWEALTDRYHSIIIQNNVEFPYLRPMGNLETVLPQGICHYVEMLNGYFVEYAQNHADFYLHDLHYLAAQIGLTRFHNRQQYHAFKFAMSYDVVPEVVASLAHLIGAVLGKMKKCLVLDLDNTLWGGVIGDDGVDNIQLGHETSVAEAYTEFQQYVLRLKERGVLLAVCSKNDEEIAKSGFNHPDSLLSIDDFVAFYANWNPKDVNIRAIAAELNIGLDSLVFIDDNPAERELVRRSLPEVAVPEVEAQDVFSYIRAIENNGYFEQVLLSEDDFKRNENYRARKKSGLIETSSKDYSEYLRSLSMKAEIASFKPVYFDRIAQLTGKTNQFNLTTRRYTRSDIERMANDKKFVTLYGRLIDRFCDNGLIAVTIAEKKGDALHILLWLMSCRVLKRGMEYAMFDALATEAKLQNIKEIYGYYYPTKKNHIVADLYKHFGFKKTGGSQDGGTVWKFSLEQYQMKNRFITIISA